MPTPSIRLLLSLLLIAAAADAEPVRTNDIEYARVDGKPLLLDLYRPSAPGAAPPLLVWVHGGAWENGSKAQMPLSALVENGFAIASLDFRPASAAPFPGQAHEIKAAIRYLRASADRHGYDATRIGILGASSGGHLAALVGTTNGTATLEGGLGDHLKESSAVQAIVSYFPASNLTTILEAIHALWARRPGARVEEAARRLARRRERRGAARKPRVPRRCG